MFSRFSASCKTDSVPEQTLQHRQRTVRIEASCEDITGMNRFVLVACGHVLLLSTKVSYNKLKIAYNNTHTGSNGNGTITENIRVYSITQFKQHYQL